MTIMSGISADILQAEDLLWLPLPSLSLFLSYSSLSLSLSFIHLLAYFLYECNNDDKI